jgi:glycosyltransferase involved in cell wall biosynthesis
LIDWATRSTQRLPPAHEDFRIRNRLCGHGVQRHGRQRVSLFGRAFKQGADDLRQSLLVLLAKRLIGRGYEPNIFDRSVNVAALQGSERSALPVSAAGDRSSLGAAIVANERKSLPCRFTGFVDDIRPAVLAGDVSVIPLRVGSGTRLKAFEAVALGRPVVSTPLGIEGLAVEPGKHCLVADTAAAFAADIVRLLEDADLRCCLAGAARGLLEERFSWASVGRQFEAICRRTIARRPGHLTDAP